MHHCIVEPAEPRPGGQQNYHVTLDGERIVTSRRPFFDAARALAARGYGGELRFYREGRPDWDFRFRDLGKAARWNVTEGESAGPRVIRYVPHYLAGPREMPRESVGVLS